jgi:proline iminopeptidase
MPYDRGSSEEPKVSSERRGLYPALEPFDSGTLDVSPLHRLYYEQSGNSGGAPALFLHGGPGSGTGPNARRFFDPAHYRIVLVDQRGSGRSTPHAELEANTTWDLVSDLERLRGHLGIERWLVFGGSWGSTLALAYAQAHPSKVSALVLRGIFLLRRWELEWLYQSGAHRMFPEHWQAYLAPIPEVERGDLISAYHRRLTGPDNSVRLTAARAWAQWEARLSFMQENSSYVAAFEDDAQALAFSRIESHYFVNGGFFQCEDQLLGDVARIRNIPAVIIHGRFDVVCPVQSALDLHRLWPEAALRIVPDAGHSAFEPGITHELIEATDRFRQLP